MGGGSPGAVSADGPAGARYRATAAQRNASALVCTASAVVPVTQVPTGNVNDHQVRLNGRCWRAVRMVSAAASAAHSAAKPHTDPVTASVHKTGRSGTALVYKGTVHSKVFGRGKVVEKATSGLKDTLKTQV